MIEVHRTVIFNDAMYILLCVTNCTFALQLDMPGKMCDDSKLCNKKGKFSILDVKYVFLSILHHRDNELKDDRLYKSLRIYLQFKSLISSIILGNCIDRVSALLALIILG